MTEQEEFEARLEALEEVAVFVAAAVALDALDGVA